MRLNRLVACDRAIGAVAGRAGLRRGPAERLTRSGSHICKCDTTDRWLIIYFTPPGRLMRCAGAGLTRSKPPSNYAARLTTCRGSPFKLAMASCALQGSWPRCRNRGAPHKQKAAARWDSGQVAQRITLVQELIGFLANESRDVEVIDTRSSHHRPREIVGRPGYETWWRRGNRRCRSGRHN